MTKGATTVRHRLPDLSAPSARAVRGLAAALALAVLSLGACAPAGEAGGGAGSATVSFPDGWEYPPSEALTTSASGGMVVTTDSLASAAGREMLRAGGNAVDAAIAVQFALAVVHPAAGNIGGGGFMVVRTGSDSTASLDFREEAPGAATGDMYLDEQGEATDASWTGPRASGVPGAVSGMRKAHEKYGSLPWERLLQPAIRLAEGIVMDEEMHDNIDGETDRLTQFPASAAKWLPADGEPVAVGDTFRQPDMARTLRAIAETGGEAFYSGWIADSLVAQMERSGGIITREDMAAYEAVWREPIEAEYRGYRLVSMPPPSSGGVTIAEILNITESVGLDTLGYHSADHVHVAVEAMRRAYGDRNYYLADPDFEEMPLEMLTSQEYADSLAASIRMDTVSPSQRFNKVPTESTETTHFSVVDSAGNAVAITTTVNGYFGSAVTVRGAGFVMNNEMNDFAVNPGEPNAFGLVQGEVNAIEPGKRMLSSMSPTIVVNPEGRTELVTGTPGGATIITTVYQMVSNHVDYGMEVGTAVNAPRFHHQNLPNEVEYERSGLADSVAAELESRGHEMVEEDGYSGDVESIYIAPDGTLVGAADPRRGGSALGIDFGGGG